MRKSTIFTFFILFCTLLLAHQIPEALAQVGDGCLISGYPYVYVQLSDPEGSSWAVGASGGACDIDPTSLPTYFGASLAPGTSADRLQIVSHGGIYPSCQSPTKGLLYDISKPAEGTIFLTDASDPRFSATLTKQGGSLGFNHLVTGALFPYFNSADASLSGDVIHGSVVMYDGGTSLLFDSPLEGCTSDGRNYVVMRNPIPNPGHVPDSISGPSFYTAQDCGTSRQIEAIYIPVNANWSLDLQCDTTYFGPVLRDNNRAVPAFSGYGMLIFCLGVFGLGILAMRKTRFGNTLAGL